MTRRTKMTLVGDRFAPDPRVWTCQICRFPGIVISICREEYDLLHLRARYVGHEITGRVAEASG